MNFSVFYGQRGVRRIQVSNLQGFEMFYGQMSEICFDREEDFQTLMQDMYRASQGNSLRNSKVIIGIVHKLNEELMELTERLSNQGSVVLLYVISDENLERYIKRSTSRRKLVVISTEEELEGVL